MICNWTPLLFLRPHRFVETGPLWESFDFDAWNRNFTWESDGWNGLKDTVTDPATTVATQQGDCDDLAVVAASWCRANDRPGAGIAACWSDHPWPTHAVAFDAERVYSSGTIHNKTFGEWLNESEYRAAFARSV